MNEIKSSKPEKTLEQLCLEASRETDGPKLFDLVDEIERKYDDQHRRAPINRAFRKRAG
jgi:hypothetical protein